MSRVNEQSWDALERKNRVKSGIATAAICVLMILLLLLFGFRPPFPPPPEEGLLIDFGNTESAFGPSNPSTRPESSPPPVQQVAEQSPSAFTDQSIEESVALPKPKPQPRPEAKPTEQVKPEPQPVQPVKEPEPEPKPVIDDRFVFSKDKHEFKSTSSSEGIREGSGNMGDPSGSKSDNYLGQSSGLGDKGISFGLAGRGMTSAPPTDNTHQEYGDIKVTIQVNQQGEVISATYSRQGSTITNRALIDKYVAYARKAKFNADANARDIQEGHITFKLTLR